MSTRFKVEKRDDKFRIIDGRTGLPARNEKSGSDIDGGGHSDSGKAGRQAKYLNEWDDDGE